MFGNGSLGALNVTSGTTYLPLNIKLQYTTVNVSAGATIRPADTAGAVLYICATESITIDGSINVSNAVNYGNNTWGVTIDGETFNSPGVANGGRGGLSNFKTSGGQQSQGFGGGGAGGGFGDGYTGGNGGNGSPLSPSGGASVTASRSSIGTTTRNGNSGVRTRGGSGGALASTAVSGNSGTATSGAGGSTYGSNGGDGSGSGSSSFVWVAEGGGGAGGRAGRAGVHLVLKSPSVTIYGTLNTSGTDGGNGGRGGRRRDSGGWGIRAGSGGGGGGGNAGNIHFRYAELIDDEASIILNGGSGGLGGVWNESIQGSQGQDGFSGDAGSVIEQQLVPSANFTSNVQTGARPLTVNFTNLSSGADSYLWDFGDGTTSTSTNPSKTYSNVGSYTVKLTATNVVGSTTETKTNYITTTINNFSRTAGGVLKLSGGISSRGYKAYRQAGGTLLFGGSTRAIVLRDAEAIQDKIYLYKVYDPDGNYIETWKDVISDLNFTHEINTIGSTTTVELARNSDTVGFVTAPLQTEDGQNLLTEFDETILVSTESRNQIGSGSSVDYNNRVDITAYYGSVEPLYTEDMEEILTEDDEPILADIGAPNGRRVFTGFISEINSRYGNSETTIVQLTSYGFDLDQYPVTTAYNNNTTTVPFNSYDPSDIVKEAIDRFVQTSSLEQVSYTMRTDTSISDSGTVVSYTFRNNTYKELLDKTLELLPSNWYYRVGLGDNTVYLRERSATPDHLFYLGKHIKALDLKGSIIDVVNHVLFTGGGDPALYVERKVTPATRTRRGLEVMSDARVTLQSSAQIIATGKTDDNNKLQYRTTVEVLTKQYDIESIQVGQTVGFRNFGNYVDELVMQVYGLAYTPDSVQLQLETKPLTINRRLEDVYRNLTVQENANTPATPS